MDKQEITQVTKGTENHPLIVGNRVFDRLLTTEHIVQFGRKKYLLLLLLLRDVPIQEAASKVDMALQDAIDFQNSDKAQEFLQDRELARLMAEEAKNEDRWWVRAELTLQGKLQLDKSQIEMMKETGRRVSPIKGDSGQTKIEININQGAVKAAFDRQDAIDAEVAQ